MLVSLDFREPGVHSAEDNHNYYEEMQCHYSINFTGSICAVITTISANQVRHCHRRCSPDLFGGFNTSYNVDLVIIRGRDFILMRTIDYTHPPSLFLHSGCDSYIRYMDTAMLSNQISNYLLGSTV